MSHTQVFVPDADAGWVRGVVVDQPSPSKFTVRLEGRENHDDLKPSSDGAGEVVEVDIAKHEVLRSMAVEDGEEAALPQQNTGLAEEGVPDMTSFDHLHEASILFNLRRRFFRALPYTYTGDIVIAVNPYRWLKDLYAPQLGDKYAALADRTRRTELPPHVYSVSTYAYRGLMGDEGGAGVTGNQSILVSGESGAGKTETVKILMGHLATVASSNSSSGSSSGGGEEEGGGGDGGTIRRIIESNPLLESFGNAKTVRNDNSSRFGKFTRLHFGHNGAMLGSLCTHYLLEKSRVVAHTAGERNYHIFYQLLAAEDTEKSKYGLEGMEASQFRYLTADGLEASAVIEGKTDAQHLQTTLAALRTIGLSEQEMLLLCRGLAAVVHLGALSFQQGSGGGGGDGGGGGGGDEEASEVGNRAQLSSPCDLLGLSAAAAGEGGGEAALEKAICSRTIRARGEAFVKPNTVQQATNVCDAMAKALYSSLFDWLVKRVNASTGKGLGGDGGNSGSSGSSGNAGSGKKGRGEISLLDIFGFESFAVNRFEQLCINYANEKLQQKFTLDTFKTVQQEYEEEGIPWSHIDFADNADVLALIESRMGVLALLNEESLLLQRGSDENFTNKLATLHKDHSAFGRSKMNATSEFSIRHYAQAVVYSTAGFLEKNRDQIGEDVTDLLGGCGNPVVREAMNGEASGGDGSASSSGVHHHSHSHSHKRKTSSMAQNTLAAKFKGSLTILMDNIGRTQVQYVRCIKPNTLKSSASLANNKVLEQLRCAGVIEAIRVSRAAYPNRLSHREFLQRFSLLRQGKGKPQQPTAPPPPPSTTSDSSDDEGLATQGSRRECRALMAAIAGPPGDETGYQLGRTRVYFRSGRLEGLERRRLEVQNSTATKLQAFTRAALLRSRYLRLLRRSVEVQAWWRSRQGKRRYLRTLRGVVLVQCLARRRSATRRVTKLRRHRASAAIQAGWRMRQQRAIFTREKQAALRLQSRIRMAQAMANYKVLATEAREAAKLENQIAALQRRLQEEHEARLQTEQAHKQLAARLEQQTDEAHAAKQAAEAAIGAAGAAAAAAGQARETGEGGEGEGEDGLALSAQHPRLTDLTAEESSPSAGGITSLNFSPRTAAAAKQLFSQESNRADLMGESTQVITQLQAEVARLRKENSRVKEENEDLKREKAKAATSQEASSMSYHALSVQIKKLSGANKKFIEEVSRVSDMRDAVEVRNLQLEEQLFNKKEEVEAHRLFYESEVTKGKKYLKIMETMVRLVADQRTPIGDGEKEELVYQLAAMFGDCNREDHAMVSAVDLLSHAPKTRDTFTASFSSAASSVSNLMSAFKRAAPSPNTNGGGASGSSGSSGMTLGSGRLFKYSS